VAKYRENFDLYFKPGHKKLMSSIKEAEEICPDKITLEGIGTLQQSAKLNFFVTRTQSPPS
jgi:hypothetical protein